MTINANEMIYSSLAEDSGLGELIEMFVEEMPDRTAVLAQAFSTGDWESLLYAAHQLKGAAGSYGFDELAPFAAAVESSVRDAESTENIGSLLDELIDACHQIRPGRPN